MPDEEREHGLVQIRQELRTFYRKQIHRGRLRHTPGEELKQLRSFKKRKQSLPSDIEIWLFFFDEYIVWASNLWLFYIDNLDHDKGPDHRHDARVCCALLSGRIVQDLLAIRDLICTGFDVASRTIARNVAEHIDLLSLVHVSEVAARELRSVDNNTKANAFWHRYCARQKIDKVLEHRRKAKIPDDDVRKAFEDWRYQYWDLVGLSVHPSLPALVGGILDSNNLRPDEGNVVDGVHGEVSHASRFTMHFLILRIYEFAHLFVRDYQSEDSDMYWWKEPAGEVLEKYVLQTRPILSWIIGAIETPKNSRVLFPEFQSYWRPKLD